MTRTRALAITAAVALSLAAALPAPRPHSSQAAGRTSGLAWARITQYSNVAGPTYYGGWDVPAPGPTVFACSWDIAGLSHIRILDPAGATLAEGDCWDRGSGLSPGPWIDTSMDLGLDGTRRIEVTP